MTAYQYRRYDGRLMDRSANLECGVAPEALAADCRRLTREHALNAAIRALRAAGATHDEIVGLADLYASLAR